ncbi:methylenetetrahydrofolate reductase [Alphaproteobacteria bacterium]|nr:methylenetetrahydrofolate reductase [Alphaproteobacteria bacterium]
MTNLYIEAAQNLITNCSIETTPNVYAKYGKFSELVNKDSNIYVTYLPDEDMNKVIDTSKKLTLEGYSVIPHLPARTISNNEELEKYIKSLSEESGCSKILVIGGGGNQKGSITSSIEILETDLLSKYNFEEVGLAGHPEGNPDVKQIDLDNAIIQKNKFSKNTDFKMYLATQFFFEAQSLKKWELHLNNLDNKLEIHAGIPGPATLKTLLSYATSCGIGNSIRFLSKQALNITKLATTSSPDKLIYDLASYQIENPETKFKKIHFYAFGGIKKTSDWLKTVNKHDMSYNGQKFE